MPDADVPFKPRIGRNIKGERYTHKIDAYIDRGGSGVVYKAYCKDRDESVALKFFLPLYQINLDLFRGSSTQRDALDQLTDLYEKEIHCLEELHHPNIVRTYDRGNHEPSDRSLSDQLKDALDSIPFFAMEYIEGRRFDQYLMEQPDPISVIKVLQSVANALEYLHQEKEYMHADIRSGNILVRDGSDEAILVDFALYKNLNFEQVQRNEYTKLLGDWDLFPKDLATDHQLKKIKETNGTREQIKELCFPALDLYQFGKLLNGLQDSLARVLPWGSYEFINYLTKELTQWESVRHKDSSWLSGQLRKIDPGYTHFIGAPELSPVGAARNVIQLPDVAIPLTDPVEAVINTRAFGRLGMVRQLAMVDQVYPGAGYKRDLHSLRAYEAGRQLLIALSKDKTFRFHFDSDGIRRALLLVLVHDMNHFPYMHIFQELMQKGLDEFNVLGFFMDGKATGDDPSLFDIFKKEGLDKGDVETLLLGEWHQLRREGYGPDLQIAKSVYDSGADVDKMAYLKYDSMFTGVKYGSGIDVNRLLSASTVVEHDEGWHVGYQEKAVPALESLVMARFWLFKTVYWHHTHRALTAMLGHVIRGLYGQGGKDIHLRNFIADTLGKSEDEVARYLDGQWRNHYGEPSILDGLLTDRDKMYKRLYEFRFDEGGERAKRLYAKVRELKNARRAGFVEALHDRIGRILTDIVGMEVEPNEGEVLVDMPGRVVDSPGPVFIEGRDGSIARLSEAKVSETVHFLRSEFERLTKRIRVFVAPRLAQKVTRSMQAGIDDVMLDIMEESLPKKDGTSQLR